MDAHITQIGHDQEDVEDILQEDRSEQWTSDEILQEVIRQVDDAAFSEHLNRYMDRCRSITDEHLNSSTKWCSYKKDVNNKHLPYTGSTNREIDDLHDVGYELARDPTIKAAIEARISFIVREGHKYRLDLKRSKEHGDESPDLIQDAMDDVKDTVDMGNDTGWYFLQEETQRRLDRDGVYFRRIFNVNGRLTVRFAEPKHIRQPQRAAAEANREGLRAILGTVPEFKVGDDIPGEMGIISMPGDAANVVGFWHYLGTDSRGLERFEVLDARRVQYRKTGGVDSNDPRGVPMFYDCYPYVKRIKEIVVAMAELVLVQSAAGLIVKKTVQTRDDKMAEFTRQVSRAVKNRKTGRPKRPGVWDAQGAEIEAPGMNVRATQFVEAIQQLQRFTAAVAQIPEFLITGDANTGNRSSLIAAEGPFATRVARDQTAQSYHDVELLWMGVRFLQGWLDRRFERVRAKYRIAADFTLNAVRDWAKCIETLSGAVEKMQVPLSVMHEKMGLKSDVMEQLLRDQEYEPPAPALATPSPTAQN